VVVVVLAKYLLARKYEPTAGDYAGLLEFGRDGNCPTALKRTVGHPAFRPLAPLGSKRPTGTASGP
jgi:hypothetical protein